MTLFCNSGPISSVGRRVPRKDSREKLTGEAKYVDDLSYPGLLYGKTIWSSISHGEIQRIEFDQEFDWGAVIIADYRDIPGDNVVPLIVSDQPLLVERRVRHKKEPILLLAAENVELLEEAAAHIRIDYEEWPPVLTVEESLTGTPILHGDDNVFKHIEISRGDVDTGFAAADAVIEETYRMGSQEQLYIEPQGMIAHPPDCNGAILVEGSMQCPHYVHRALKGLFNLADDKVIVRQTVTGGGFGGKEEYPNNLAGHAALLALKSGRPVKMVYDRSEDLAVTAKRHPAIIRHRTGVTHDGRLTAMQIDILLDGGAYCTLSPVVLSRGAIHAVGPYSCPNVRIEARAVATNNPPFGAFRGFGVPQVCFAVESQLNKVAGMLGMSPLAIRRINLLRTGDETATGQKLTSSVGAEKVLDTVVAASGYETHHNDCLNQSGTKRRGIGLSTFFHGAGFTGSGELNMRSGAAVELCPDGMVKILSSSTEIGQGTRTIFCQIVADAVGIPFDQVFMEEPDTSRVPDSGPTVASRTCMIIGGVLAQAAGELNRILKESVASSKGLDGEHITLRDGRFVCDGVVVESMAEAAQRYFDSHGSLRVFRRYDPPPELAWDESSYRGDAYAAYAFAADVVEVEVDLETCEISVLKVMNASDVGRAIHPSLAEGQIEGGTLQGVGYATLENVIMEQGRMLNDRLTDYLIPTSVDAPEISTILVESEYPHGPYGAKGIGELPMDGAAPAVVAAIHNATGVLITELPLTPERLQHAIENAHSLESQQ